MAEGELFDESRCEYCVKGAGLDFDFSFAYQPIIDAEERRVWGHEALVRGVNGEGAGTILSRVTEKNQYPFDQACRVRAVRLASQLGIDGFLSINFLPHAVYRPEHCIRTTLAAAKRYGVDTRKLMFELTENQQLTSTDHLEDIIRTYQSLGFLTALDDFGAGYSRLNLLISCPPQFLKLDMQLIRNIHESPRKQALVEGIALSMDRLGIQVIAEGVEYEEEYRWLRQQGIRYYQGFLFAKPGFEHFPEPYYPD
ncbi:EAL domain-containing protein [Marinobacteraceae bacterium S3BR75-40.1]